MNPRLTLLGGPAVEGLLHELLGKATKTILRFVPRDHLKSLALVGAYGRGEGGIAVVEGAERPGSPLELTLFTVDVRAREREHLGARIERELAGLARRYGVEIDLDVEDARHVERERARLRWYAAAHGHRHLAGERAFLSGLSPFPLAEIQSKDAADLIVNGGARLVLNELILASGHLDPIRHEALLANTAAAIVGYGDALLLWRGAYHWSDVERRRRMAGGASPAHEGFKSLYEAAMSYRLEGSVLAARRLTLAIEGGHLKETLRSLHLETERRRLGPHVRSFEGHVERLLKHEADEHRPGVRRFAQGALTLVRDAFRKPGALESNLREAGPATTVRALFPLILYGVGSPEDKEAARAVLNVRSSGSLAARAAWLRMWSRVSSPHLDHTLRRLGLSAAIAA